MATVACTRCQAQVPAANAELHEARCGGAPNNNNTTNTNNNSNNESRPMARDVPLQIVRELTWARTRPGEVVEALRDRLQHYKGKDYSPHERHGRCVVTKEGPAVVMEAIAFVEELLSSPLGALDESQDSLNLSGEDHIADVGQTGTASHDSSDGTSAAQRVARYGTFEVWGECLWYGSDAADARTIVLDLIVDDGVPSRGHRRGVLDRRYTTVGVAYGVHCTFGRMAAMEFAAGWEPNAMFVRLRLQAGPVKMAADVLAKAKSKSDTAWALGSCPLCQAAIKGGRVVDIPQLGGKLHADCFKCASCSTALAGGAYKVHSRLPYCSPCFADKHGDKCKACGLAVTGGMVRCSLGTLHVECVICASCQKSVGKGRFTTAGDKISCEECEAAAKAASAAGGGAAVGGRPPATSTSRGSRGPGALSSAGSIIAAAPKGAARGAAAAPKAVAAAAKAAVAKPKPKAAAPKASMGKAKTLLDGLCMDYASLE
ncbi:unnamed protein product [Polarella glacialis]|uniref:LIM zinc-binding domain-containing protein n=1 Tax=Polarella glacialis TaxID=89957 RepID=A0A813IRF2_POLGL|nr:unnamed protein product [Polarella glacialis]